uniref:Putative site-specific DNA endonuclease n=1 Tax=Dicloster acuatus TaxID=91190 RepID=A0A097KQM4_9CHLO|nr:putative site-specific DNA endonuclease [Dicloster acuatus]YP_009106656.1 putative site-specific DNA endonuclease [Dicloster acuatus]AIT95465.1 putative site-specific DNA endonuclease [Dicloster acuatus]AIT95470.1 putative site-specific DNA endonuclease [Dicloster acuatus]
MNKLLKVTKNQKEILFGILLGDAHAEFSQNGQCVRLKIEQSLFHQAYVEHLYQVFQPWVKGRLREARGKKLFSTSFSPSLKFYATQFYSGKTKKVPKLIHRWLTAKSLAYWYMDDGSMKSKQSKGVLLNTQGFCFKDVKRLCDVLQSKFQLQCIPRRQKEGYQIYISGHSYERLRELIFEFLLPEMRYKFPLPRQKPKLPG